MSFRVVLRGVSIVQNTLDKATVYVKEGFDRRTGEEMLDHLQNSMPSYPPMLPGQRYVRTYKLARALVSDIGGSPMSLSDVRAFGGRQVVILGLKGGSQTLYGPAVVGFTNQQRDIHKGRWFTLLEHIKDQLGELAKLIAKGLKRAI